MDSTAVGDVSVKRSRSEQLQWVSLSVRYYSVSLLTRGARKMLKCAFSVLLLVVLFAGASASGADLTATWTGNKETDYSMFAETSSGWPEESLSTADLPNTLGRQGGSPIVYGHQIICRGVYHAVSRIENDGSGGCREAGGQTVCDNVDVLSFWTDLSGNIGGMDPLFEAAACRVTDERRGPEDLLKNEKLICDDFVLPDHCQLKDVIGFRPLGEYQGVPDYELQMIYLPEPPGHRTVGEGDFALTVDLAMTDADSQGGYFYMGPVVHFLATGDVIMPLWVNWGGLPEKYILCWGLGAPTVYSKDSLGWNPLLHESGAGALSLRLNMVGTVVAASYPTRHPTAVGRSCRITTWRTGRISAWTRDIVLVSPTWGAPS